MGHVSMLCLEVLMSGGKRSTINSEELSHMFLASCKRSEIEIFIFMLLYGTLEF
jgi:hypothetical protein